MGIEGLDVDTYLYERSEPQLEIYNLITARISRSLYKVTGEIDGEEGRGEKAEMAERLIEFRAAAS